MRWGAIAAVFTLLWSVWGCTDSSYPPSLNEPAPSFHTYPSWIGGSEFVFESKGIVAFGPGWANRDFAKSGIYLLNTETNEVEMLVRGGVAPGAMPSNGLFAGLLFGVEGALIVGDKAAWSEVDEPWEWGTRSNVGMNNDGDRVIWRSLWSDHETGVWEYNLNSQEYRFVSEGFHPMWSPVGDQIVLVQREMINIANVHLVLFEFSSGEFDTLRTFEIGEAAGDVCFSPDGSQLAYFHLNLDSEKQGIHVFSLESRVSRQLTSGRGEGLAWGPAGIVYSDACWDVNNDGCGVLWLVNVDSGTKRQLTSRLQEFGGEERRTKD